MTTTTVLIRIAILLGFALMKVSSKPVAEVSDNKDAEAPVPGILPNISYIDYNLKSCHQEDYDVPWAESLAQDAARYVGRSGLQSGHILGIRMTIRKYSARLAARHFCSSKSKFFSNNSPLSVGCAHQTGNSNADLNILCLYSMAGVP